MRIAWTDAASSSQVFLRALSQRRGIQHHASFYSKSPSRCWREQKSCARHELGYSTMKSIKYCFFLIAINIVATIFNPTNAQYNPPVFQGSSIRPRMGDVSILANSLRARDDTQTLALEAYNELIQVISNKRNELPNDWKTRDWFKENIESLAKKVMSMIEIGDYTIARTTAISYIGEINLNSELVARIECYKEYKYYVIGIQNRSDLTYKQKQDWMATYIYKFIPIYDAYGKVIGGKPWIEVGGPNDTHVVIPEYQGR